ncbi:hypothetical protein AGLY_002238 [Aphis glycines]|uniref:Uncharacterized protein n=1 Tax=Aphis glycines TaxID=307491 RepID=A0A6G0U2U5_APHGL|nr:hypothetical protein AGLY_002238 [Aphis glycines]
MSIVIKKLNIFIELKKKYQAKKMQNYFNAYYVNMPHHFHKDLTTLTFLYYLFHGSNILRKYRSYQYQSKHDKLVFPSFQNEKVSYIYKPIVFRLSEDNKWKQTVKCPPNLQHTTVQIMTDYDMRVIQHYVVNISVKMFSNHFIVIIEQISNCSQLNRSYNSMVMSIFVFNLPQLFLYVEIDREVMNVYATAGCICLAVCTNMLCLKIPWIVNKVSKFQIRTLMACSLYYQSYINNEIYDCREVPGIVLIQQFDYTSINSIFEQATKSVFYQLYTVVAIINAVAVTQSFYFRPTNNNINV